MKNKTLKLEQEDIYTLIAALACSINLDEDRLSSFRDAGTDTSKGEELLRREKDLCRKLRLLIA